MGDLRYRELDGVPTLVMALQVPLGERGTVPS